MQWEDITSEDKDSLVNSLYEISKCKPGSIFDPKSIRDVSIKIIPEIDEIEFILVSSTDSWTIKFPANFFIVAEKTLQVRQILKAYNSNHIKKVRSILW